MSVNCLCYRLQKSFTRIKNVHKKKLKSLQQTAKDKIKNIYEHFVDL